MIVIMKNSSLQKSRDTTDSSLTWYLDRINKIPMLTREEEDLYARLAKNGDPEAKNVLVKSNLRFVVSIAKKYQTNGISLLDLINEGNMGLIKAAEKFDPDKGFHFISYAVWWIRQAIMLAISQKTSLIRIPLNRSADLQKVEKVHKSLESKLHREPTAEEISEGLDMNNDQLNYLKNIPQEFVSLDAAMSDSDDTPIVNMIEDDRGDSPDKEILNQTLSNEIKNILETLTKSEREIIKMRFGLDEHKPMSLQQIGDKYGLSKERIRQIEKKALRKLNASPIRRNLEGFMGE